MKGSGSPRKERKKKIIHRSKYEDTVIQNLTDRGIEFEYEPRTFVYQRPVRRAQCSSCGNDTGIVVLRRYTPDIRLKVNGVFIELKGKFTGENRSQMEDFLRGSPGIDLRFLFMRDNWLTGKHKSRYSDWCRKLKVKYAIGTEIPDDWLK